LIRKDDIIEENVACVPSVGEEQPIAMTGEAADAEKELEKIAVDSNKALKTKNTSKNFAMTLLFIAVNVLAVVLTALMEFSKGEKPAPFSTVFNTYMENWGWLVAAGAMFCLTVLFQSMKRHLFLKSTLNKKLPLISMNATLLCKYYDNITPLGSGGQPFEIYYLRKKGIPIGVASGVPLVSYALDRIAFVLIIFVVLITYGFGQTTTAITVLCIIGLVINAAIPFALLFCSVMPKTAEKVATFVAKIAKALHLTKDVDTFKHKLTDNISDYTECIKYFVKKSKMRMLLGIILSILYFMALYTIPYCTIRMSGNSNIGWGEMFALCVICYTSVAILPTPGNSGGAELSFRAIFARFLSGGTLFWAIMSWRLFSYYLSIFVGIVLIIGQSIFKFTKTGKLERERAKKDFADSVLRMKAKDQALAESEMIEDSVAKEPEKEETVVSSVGYTPVTIPAEAPTIHDDGELSTGAIVVENLEIHHSDEVTSLEAPQQIIHVKALISPEEGLKVTEVTETDESDDSQEESASEEQSSDEASEVVEKNKNAEERISQNTEEPVKITDGPAEKTESQDQTANDKTDNIIPGSYETVTVDEKDEADGVNEKKDGGADPSDNK